MLEQGDGVFATGLQQIPHFGSAYGAVALQEINDLGDDSFIYLSSINNITTDWLQFFKVNQRQVDIIATTDRGPL